MTSTEKFRIREQMRALSALWQRHQQPSGAAWGRVKVTYDVIREFEELSSHLYRVRDELPPADPLRRDLENLLADTSHDILAFSQRVERQGRYAGWVERYRAVWVANFPLFLLTTLVAIAAGFIGWHLTIQEPDFAAVFIGQGMMERVIENNRWFSGAGESPLISGIAIAKNNISVSILAYLGGAILGLGGAYILLFNFLMLGSILAFCYLHGFETALTDFIVGHGPLELTIIVASVFAGFLFGRVFYMRPYRLFRERMSQAGSESAAVLIGILPWLVVAAAVETFISPLEGLGFEFKFLIGVTIAAIFWVWTFWKSNRHGVAEQAIESSDHPQPVPVTDG